MIPKEEIQILVDLGLTVSQATVYLSLVRFESASARTLSMVSSVARQDVYQILSALEELGLVERILAKPLKFRATHIKNALTVLQQRVSVRTSDLNKRAITLFSQSKYWDIPSKGSFESFFEVRNAYRDDPSVKEALAKARNTVRLLGSNFRWPVWFSFMDETISASQRGVKVQILMSAHQKALPPSINDVNIETRFSKNIRGANVVIFDRNKVTMWENSDAEQTAHLPVKALWSNHPGLIELFIDYFELKWNSATPSDGFITEVSESQ
ncbi:MAG: hypothetical protein NWF05_08835 [Candidatus Bathyarchaeota archaeon]|nr:hypothetical protein [Candidatus Bathyarchaeota archaeon]